MHTTLNGRTITEQHSDSPVTRVRFKKNELVLRYANGITSERQDAIYDIMIALEKNIDGKNPTVRVKILETDDLNTIQFEIGNTDYQTKILKKRGVDY